MAPADMACLMLSSFLMIEQAILLKRELEPFRAADNDKECIVGRAWKVAGDT